MSIASRMIVYGLYRSTNSLDAYGIMNSTPVKITDIMTSITKNSPTHDNTFPSYDITSYIGITKYNGVVLGDILINGTNKYQVKDIGNKGTVYQPLLLEKIQ